MLNSFHKQATTTPKIRATIRAGTEPASVAAESYRISDQTVWKWRDRVKVVCSTTPHRLQAKLTHAKIAVALASCTMLLVPLSDSLLTVREFLNPKVSRSKYDRGIRRRVFGSLRNLQAVEARFKSDFFNILPILRLLCFGLLLLCAAPAVAQELSAPWPAAEQPRRVELGEPFRTRPTGRQLTPGGDILLTDRDRAARMSGRSGQKIWQVQSFPQHEEERPRVTWSMSPDDSYLVALDVTLGKNATFVAVVYDAQNGRKLHTLQPDMHTLTTSKGEMRSFPRQAWGITFSPDSRHLAITSDGHGASVRFFDLESGELIHRILLRDVVRLSPPTYDTTGRYVYSIGWDKTLRTWETTTWKEVHQVRIPSELRLAKITVRKDGMLVLRDREHGGAIVDPSRGVVRTFDRSLQTLPFLPGDVVANGLRTVVGDRFLLDTETRQEVAELASAHGPFKEIVPGPDGRYLFALTEEAVLQVWSARTGSPLAVYPLGDTASLYEHARRRVGFNPRGEVIVLADGTFQAPELTINRFPAIGAETTPLHALVWDVEGSADGVVRGHLRVDPEPADLTYGDGWDAGFLNGKARIAIKAGYEDATCIKQTLVAPIARLLDGGVPLHLTIAEGLTNVPSPGAVGSGPICPEKGAVMWGSAPEHHVEVSLDGLLLSGRTDPIDVTRILPDLYIKDHTATITAEDLGRRAPIPSFARPRPTMEQGLFLGLEVGHSQARTETLGRVEISAYDRSGRRLGAPLTFEFQTFLGHRRIDLEPYRDQLQGARVLKTRILDVDVDHMHPGVSSWRVPSKWWEFRDADKTPPTAKKPLDQTVAGDWITRAWGGPTIRYRFGPNTLETQIDAGPIRSQSIEFTDTGVILNQTSDALGLNLEDGILTLAPGPDDTVLRLERDASGFVETAPRKATAAPRDPDRVQPVPESNTQAANRVARLPFFASGIWQGTTEEGVVLRLKLSRTRTLLLRQAGNGPVQRLSVEWNDGVLTVPQTGEAYRVKQRDTGPVLQSLDSATPDLVLAPADGFVTTTALGAAPTPMETMSFASLDGPRAAPSATGAGRVEDGNSRVTPARDAEAAAPDPLQQLAVLEALQSAITPEPAALAKTIVSERVKMAEIGVLFAGVPIYSGPDRRHPKVATVDTI